MASYTINKRNDDKDTSYQLDLNNVITSRMDENIHDGQKRYKTLTSMPNYPKPKTMFYVYFDCDNEYSEDLSKYVVEVIKPNVTITSTKMNQYNRIKYVIENVDYGDLKITFMDVKDDPIEKAFFTYLQSIYQDFDKTTNQFQTPDPIKKYKRYTQWGLSKNSNSKMIRSITIIEAYYDKIIAYNIQNPVLSSIDFGSNKIGDYSPNQIVVTFKVEGINNEIIIDGNTYDIEAIGESIQNIGGAKLAHKIGKRWDYEHLSYNERNKIIKNGNDRINNIDDQILKTFIKLLEKTNLIKGDMIDKAIIDYLNYPNKGDYTWIKIDNNSSYGIKTSKSRTFVMSGLNKVTNNFDF